jgi:hypothetical protein
MREILLDGCWYRLDDTHTTEGLTVSLRTDISAIKQLNQRLDAGPGRGGGGQPRQERLSWRT